VNALTKGKYFYEVEFNKPGGMIMPILVEITYEDDTVDNFNICTKLEKSNDSAKKVYATEKQSRKFKLTQIRNSRY
jgi:hypothetical protein